MLNSKLISWMLSGCFSKIIALKVPIFFLLFQNFTRSLLWHLNASYSILGIYFCHQILQHFLSAKFLIIQDNGYKLIKFACTTSIFNFYVGFKKCSLKLKCSYAKYKIYLLIWKEMCFFKLDFPVFLFDNNCEWAIFLKE
jgi:hypothetical protein